MNNVIYINKDPILLELENAIDKESTKKMLAFQYFNNNTDLLDKFLEPKFKNNISEIPRANNFIPKDQLEFSFK